MDNELILKKFGHAVKLLRESKRLTQEAFAERCNLHPVFISEIERGVKKASIITIIQISEALEIPPADLMKQAFSISEPNKQKVIGFILQQPEESVEKILRALQGFFK